MAKQFVHQSAGKTSIQYRTPDITNASWNTHSQDIIAQISHARNLAKKLQPVAKMIELHGGHLVCHERVDEVRSSSQ